MAERAMGQECGFDNCATKAHGWQVEDCPECGSPKPRDYVAVPRDTLDALVERLGFYEWQVTLTESGVPTEEYCSACARWREDGHAEGCLTDAALRAAREKQS